MEKEAEKILTNIIELAELLDDETLQNAPDVPIMELAKSVTIKKTKLGKERKSEQARSITRSQKRDARVLAVWKAGKLPRSCG
jgi:hypothetical protein